MEMDLNNRLTEDETLEQAYDIFLELAVDNLDPADVILFNLQFEERGGAELFDPSEDWAEHVDFDLNPDFFAEVVIGLGHVNDTFTLPINQLVQGEKRVVGSLYGSSNTPLQLPEVLRLYQDGRLPLEKLVSSHVALTEIDVAMDRLAAGGDPCRGDR